MMSTQHEQSNVSACNMHERTLGRTYMHVSQALSHLHKAFALSHPPIVYIARCDISVFIHYVFWHLVQHNILSCDIIGFNIRGYTLVSPALYAAWFGIKYFAIGRQSGCYNCISFWINTGY